MASWHCKKDNTDDNENNVHVVVVIENENWISNFPWEIPGRRGGWRPGKMHLP